MRLASVTSPSLTPCSPSRERIPVPASNQSIRVHGHPGIGRIDPHHVMPKVTITLEDTGPTEFTMAVETDPPRKDLTREQAFASPSIHTAMAVKKFLQERDAEAKAEEASDLSAKIGKVAEEVGGETVSTTA